MVSGQLAWALAASAGLSAVLLASAPLFTALRVAGATYLLLLGALPTWPYSSSWGYYPIGGVGLLLIVIIVLALTRRR